MKSSYEKRSNLDALFNDVYVELRGLARAQRRRWQGDYTMNTTALIHEAYLKLASQNKTKWNDRHHFLAVASKAMRQILVNYSQRKRSAKRGGEARIVTLDENMQISAGSAEELLALDEGLKALERQQPRLGRVTECRFFAGLSVEETAAALDISPATVKRDWALASAWLYRYVAGKSVRS
jgi:RNA polymerase sigma factor (TIGR02999 family)